MVKMSADFPNEAARCQRFLSEGAQSNFEPRGQNGPAATRSPCYLMENTRSKDRVRGTNSVKRAVAQLGRAPGSGPVTSAGDNLLFLRRELSRTGRKSNWDTSTTRWTDFSVSQIQPHLSASRNTMKRASNPAINFQANARF